MNQFDFWVIDAVCDRKMPLRRAGVPASGIHRELVGYKRYGRSAYPRYRYRASVGFVDAPEGRDALNAAEAELQKKFAGSGVSLAVRYHCSD